VPLRLQRMNAPLKRYQARLCGSKQNVWAVLKSAQADFVPL
jgi:hypothetical protein